MKIQKLANWSLTFDCHCLSFISLSVSNRNPRKTTKVECRTKETPQWLVKSPFEKKTYVRIPLNIVWEKKTSWWFQPIWKILVKLIQQDPSHCQDVEHLDLHSFHLSDQENHWKSGLPFRFSVKWKYSSNMFYFCKVSGTYSFFAMSGSYVRNLHKKLQQLQPSHDQNSFSKRASLFRLHV